MKRKASSRWLWARRITVTSASDTIQPACSLPASKKGAQRSSRIRLRVFAFADDEVQAAEQRAAGCHRRAGGAPADAGHQRMRVLSQHLGRAALPVGQRG